MDAKGLAKSKRAHSRSHHNTTRHKHTRPQHYPNKHSSLPSNWDRYSDSAPDHNQNPRIRGADYRHLIAEAEAHSATSVDDVVPDEFSAGVSSMLSIRGDGILAWLADDNFMVDHQTSLNPHPQPSFLSLNLHLLADHLEKLDLCDRLFLQPDDLLPPDPDPDLDLLPEEGQVQPSHSAVPIKVASHKLEAELDTLLGELDFSTEFPPVKTDVRVPLNNVSLDDELDDLLKQTAIPGESEPSNPKFLNDFDSWLDTL